VENTEWTQFINLFSSQPKIEKRIYDMNSTPIRHPSILRREETALLIIDIQEKIFRVMQNSELIIQNTIKLIEGFRILGSHIFVTEQYPKGLGETEIRLKEVLQGVQPIQKMIFSCSGAGELFNTLKEKQIKQVILAGIESHVCVQQTALDLIANGFQVSLAADACSSRKEIDFNLALNRMRTTGVIISTTEAILFEMLTICGTDEFKKISKILK
jgi:nicotinamidase-related amidase